ncbi:MAG UNVERIFIED_CONTAM: tetratricopeptide repeat protein [Rickettsiaceae bacterium]|jgi:tetratricopeptide (TPR) repeat protein
MTVMSSLNTGDYDQARSNFERALLARPNEAYIIYSLAATLLQLGEIDLTIENLQRAIMLQPRLRSQLINDSDFTELRENRQFLAMMGVTSQQYVTVLHKHFVQLRIAGVFGENNIKFILDFLCSLIKEM